MSEELKQALLDWAETIEVMHGIGDTGIAQRRIGYLREAARLLSSPRVEDGEKLREIHTFLLGEGPLDGRWFGDEPPVVGRLRRPFWWRTNLRAALPDGEGKEKLATRASGPTAPTDRL